MMEERLLLPSWPSAENLYTSWKMEFALADPPAQPFHAHWLEMRHGKEAEALLASYEVPSTKTSRNPTFQYSAAGRFLCLRRLLRGPVFKLSHWEQLETGQSILLHPEPLSKDLTAASGTVDRMRRAARGDFNLKVRSDGTLWLQCQLQATSPRVRASRSQSSTPHVRREACFQYVPPDWTPTAPRAV